MNLAFYGHARNLVLSYNVNGLYNDTVLPSGLILIHQLTKKEQRIFNNGGYLSLEQNVNPDDYRCEYYGMHRYETDNKSHFAISRYLGYREGKTAYNIYNVPPEDPALPIDMLTVWDEGYGGLTLPENCRCVFWASDKALPDREQFEKIADKCLLFLDADVLRSAGAMISRQISWERTTSELLSQIQNNPAINYLFNARYIFIPFSVDGAVILIPRNIPHIASLILTHGGAEGAVNEKHQGKFIDVFPFMASRFTMGAEVIHHVFDNNDTEYLEGALKMLREILEVGETTIHKGYDLYEEGNNVNIGIRGTLYKLRGWESFPIPLEQRDNNMLCVPGDWTVTSSVGSKKMYDMAFNYVLEGSKVIAGLPQLSFGALTTVDRWEIEAYQNIRNLMLGFANGDTVRPLSIAVFGAPGAGKSFGVTQIAKNIMPGKVEKLEFNVSQFVNLGSLGTAFQKVRDVTLEGKLPLVFFDEFDSDRDGLPLGWVKSFLMPMQDGRFYDETGEHPLGKCILVFAGGTAASFEDFVAPMNAVNPDKQRAFKNVKGPDFVSRLKGTINVLGPNPKNENDKNYILRRALLLRSLCERKLPMKDGKTHISPSIINALLLVSEYRHGARSMEAILDMSRTDSGALEPAFLPVSSQLSLHVDADEFINLVLKWDN